MLLRLGIDSIEHGSEIYDEPTGDLTLLRRFAKTSRQTIWVPTLAAFYTTFITSESLTLAMNSPTQSKVKYNPKGMPFRRLGPSGLRVPLFSLGGCMSDQILAEPTDRERTALVARRARAPSRRARERAYAQITPCT